MNVNQYQEGAELTINWRLSALQMLDNAALGLSGEAGEIAEIVKKHIYHGHHLDKAKLMEELGDLQWYIVQCCVAIDCTLEQVMWKNNEKLAIRYKEGFSHEASRNRTR